MGLQEIFNKLHNTNLAKEEFEKTNLTIHKVELGLKQDFDKESSKAINAGIDTGDALNKLNSQANNIKQMINGAIKLQYSAISLGNRLVEKYKELGVDVPNDVRKGIDGADQWAKELIAAEKIIQNFKF